MTSIVFISILFLAAFIPGSIILVKSGANRPAFKYWLVYAGAFLFSITIVHLIPELFIQAENVLVISIFILLGFFMQIGLDYFTSGVEHGHAHHHQHVSIFTLMLGLMIHALMDGVILVHPGHIEHDHSLDHSWSILVGIVFHKIPAAMVLVTLLLTSVTNKKSVLWYLLLFALSSPLGYLLSYYSSDSGLLGSGFFNILFAIVSGNFLHISTTIYFESSPEHKFDHKKLLYALLGAFTAVGVELMHG